MCILPVRLLRLYQHIAVFQNLSELHNKQSDTLMSQHQCKELPIHSNVSGVVSAKILGVHLRHDLNFSQHVESVVAICNQRLFVSTAQEARSWHVTARFIQT